MTFRTPLLAACAALLIAAPVALAANGITVVSPKSGAKVKTGTAPTFKVKVQGEGSVWVHVCKSKKKDSEGVICHDGSIGRAKKKGSTFSYKPEFFDAHQLKTLERLAEAIVPGSTSAKVAPFLDQLIAVRDPQAPIATTAVTRQPAMAKRADRGRAAFDGIKNCDTS